MKKFLEITQDLRFYFVLVSLVCLTLVVKYTNLKEEHKKILTNNLKQENLIDSLNDEIYVKNINLGSYELMWELLEEVNKPLADSINNQVE